MTFLTRYQQEWDEAHGGPGAPWSRRLPLAFPLLLLAFLLVAEAVQEYGNARRIATMPAEVCYVTVIRNNTYPAVFFSESYSLADPNGFSLPTYWTWEGKWEYHPVPLTMTEIDSTTSKLMRR